MISPISSQKRDSSTTHISKGIQCGLEAILFTEEKSEGLPQSLAKKQVVHTQSGHNNIQSEFVLVNKKQVSKIGVGQCLFTHIVGVQFKAIREHHGDILLWSGEHIERGMANVCIWTACTALMPCTKDLFLLCQSSKDVSV